MFRDDIPDRRTIRALIFVPQQVANCGDLTPRDFRRERFIVVRNAASCFGDYLQTAFDRSLHAPILHEGIVGHARDQPSIPFMASRMSVRRRRTLRGTSEYAKCFRLDPCPKHRMKTGAGHHVRVHAEDGTDALLHVDQFD